MMKKPPLVAGLPVFGNGLDMLNDPLAFLVNAYHEYGSIFRLRVWGREVVVLAGLEANRLLMTMGAGLAKGGVYTGFSSELGQDAHFSAIDGDEHLKLRRATHKGYGKRRYLCHVPHMIDLIRARTGQWQNGDIVPVVATMEQIIGELLGTLLTQHPVGEHFDDFRTVIKLLHFVYPMRVMPRLTLRLPPYQNAKKRIFAFAERILAHHIAQDSASPTLVDDLIAAHQRTDNPLTREQVIGQIFTPYFVGIDTVGATISFLTYLLLTHKNVLQSVIAEVDAAFCGDTFVLDALPTLERAIHETMRLYPIAPFLARRAMQDFSFAGYDIQQGTELIVAVGVTHYLEAYYAQPHQFNVERTNDVPAGVFSTWGLGAHSCLGAGIAEMLMKVVMATILREWTLHLHPKDYRMKLSLAPLPNPGASLKVSLNKRN